MARWTAKFFVLACILLLNSPGQADAGLFRPRAQTRACCCTRLMSSSTWQACFYERTGQYAGSAVGAYETLAKQCENWGKTGGYCTFHIYPYNCPQRCVKTLKPTEVVDGASPPTG